MLQKPLVALLSGLVLLGPLLAGAQPQLLAPDSLDPEGQRFTLTPSFTPDGQQMYFAQSNCVPIWECPQVLKTSRYENGQWSSAEAVPLPRGYSRSVPRVDYPEVVEDGRALLFSWSGQLERDPKRNAFENFDLFRLDLTIDKAVPKRLQGGDLNRFRGFEVATLRFVNNETAPSVSNDGTLYFWSERLDGPGERDAYFALPNGQVGYKKPVPFPPPINSAGRDDGLWVHPSGRLLLMTYSDRGGEGGGDIFLSVMSNGVWEEPRNLGVSVNSHKADFSAKLTPDGKRIVWTSFRDPDATQNSPARVWVTDVVNVPILADALREIGVP